MTRDRYVYRLYDAAGTLLYVGVTKNPAKRRARHAATQQWWPAVASWRLFGPLTRTDAYAIEARAIRTESPLHNRYRPRDAPGFADYPYEYVGTHEIAQALGLIAQRIAQLAERPTFPAPYDVIKAGRIWLTKDVHEWAAANGYPKG